MTNIMSDRARRLRREKTEAERKLWRELRTLNRQGFRFRQQAPVGPYIADFADHTAKLVIELDGGQHGMPSNAARDALRTKWLSGNGYRVLRYWNGDVLNNTSGVMAAVMVELGLLSASEGAA
ncbi:endonuclease domain-containing protein [Hyphomicrobium sp.]|uniref:endonuclease domain-containing protein n=1 Tax=Hyphomicrobium sp. TaxID=82 RepID=UPI003F701964